MKFARFTAVVNILSGVVFGSGESWGVKNVMSIENMPANTLFVLNNFIEGVHMKSSFSLTLTVSTLVLIMGILPNPLVLAQAEIKLPPPSLTGTMSVEKAIVGKKSVRRFSTEALDQSQVAQLLWAANGNLPVDAVAGATYKAIPSAGGLYPLEVFLVTGQDTVKGLPAGIYAYEPRTHSLKLIAQGDNRMALAHAALSQTWLAGAPAIIVIGGVFSRSTIKYGNRGIQYVFMESGNSNQNLYLQAEALRLKMATIGAFQEAQVSSVLKLQSDVTPLLLVGVGK
jgi:SagB-type dehydrogenase family enzyme